MTDKSDREEMIAELKRKEEENRISEELNAYLFQNSHEAYLYRRRKEKNHSIKSSNRRKVTLDVAKNTVRGSHPDKAVYHPSEMGLQVCGSMPYT